LHTREPGGRATGNQILKQGTRTTEVISEVFVPREALSDFMADLRRDLLAGGSDIVGGNVCLVKREDETFLGWAREDYACLSIGLRVLHTPAGIGKAGQELRTMLGRAIEHKGSFSLAYHRWATREQIESCYPQFVEFLRLKRQYDPNEVFQSSWYRYYENMFADVL